MLLKHVLPPMPIRTHLKSKRIRIAAEFLRCMTKRTRSMTRATMEDPPLADETWTPAFCIRTAKHPYPELHNTSRPP